MVLLAGAEADSPEKTSALPSIVMFESVRLPPSTAIMLPVQDGARLTMQSRPLRSHVCSSSTVTVCVTQMTPSVTFGEMRAAAAAKVRTGVSSVRPSLESLPLTPSR